MAVNDLPISQLPTATTVTDLDLFAIVQGGVTKQAVGSLIKGTPVVIPSEVDHLLSFSDTIGTTQNTSLIYEDSTLPLGTKALTADVNSFAIYPVGMGGGVSGTDLDNMAFISFDEGEKRIDLNATNFISIAATGTTGTPTLSLAASITQLSPNSGTQIKIGGALPAVDGAKIDIQSTDAGFANARLTTAQKLAISPVGESVSLYDTDLHAPCFYNGTYWVSSFNALQAMFEPTGFPMPDDINVAIDEGTRTVTLSPAATSFYFFVWAVRFDKTAAENITFPDDEGYHYIYYDITGTLQQIHNPTVVDIEELTRMDAIAVIVYWDATNGEAIYFTANNELHGVQMDGSTHANMHFTDGTKFLQGAALNTINTGGTGNDDADAQFGVDLGVGLDEDRPFTALSVASTTGAAVHYLEGAAGGVPRRAFNAGFSVLTGGTGLVQFNEDVAGTLQLTEAGSGNYVWYHIFLTNNSPYGFIAVPGVAEYALSSTAKDAAADDLGVVIGRNFGIIENKAVGSVLIETKSSFGNAVKARLVPTSSGDYEDWRFENITSTIAPTNHNSLGGLTVGHPHPQYLQTDVVNNQTTIVQTTPIAGGFLLDAGGGIPPYMDGVNALAISGQYAYVGSANALQILDISDPENIRQLGSVTDGFGGSPYLNGVKGIEVKGEYLYVTSGDSGAIQVINVRDKSSPVPVSHILNNGTTILLSSATSSTLKGNILFVGSLTYDSVQAFDVSNPNNIIPRGSISSSPPTIYLNNVLSMQFTSSGDYLICTDRPSDAIQIIDVRDPDNLIAVSNIVDGGGSAPYLNAIYDIKVRGSYLYCVSDVSDAFQILDISDINTIAVKGYILDAGGSSEPYLNGARKFVLSGDYAYVGQSPGTPGPTNNGIQVLNISDVNNITASGRLNDGEGSAPYLQGLKTLEISGGYLHTCSTEGVEAYQTIKIGNIKVPTANIGTIKSDLIETRDLRVDNNLCVGNSITVGGNVFDGIVAGSIRGWAILNANQSVASGSPGSIIEFDVLETPSYGVSLSGNAIVFETAGFYSVEGAVKMPSTTSGNGRLINFKVDTGGGFVNEETDTERTQQGLDGFQYIRLTAQWKYFSVGDELKLNFWQDSGTSQEIIADSFNTYLKVSYLSDNFSGF